MDDRVVHSDGMSIENQASESAAALFADHLLENASLAKLLDAVGGEILVKRRSESETDHGNVAARRDGQAR